MSNKLPESEEKSQTSVVNGGAYTNLEGMEERRKTDAEALAGLIYEIYKEQKETKEVAQQSFCDVH